MRCFSGRKFGRNIMLASMLFGSARGIDAQEYIRDFYPYLRDAEEYAPLLQTDTALFYRAVQTAPDLYGACTDYRLPLVASGRRGRAFSDEQTRLNGMPIDSYRTRALLRTLGATEEYRTGAAAPSDGYVSAAENVRIFRFDESTPLRPYYAALSLTDRNYRIGARVGWSGELGKNWYGSAAVDARTGRDMHIEGVFTDAVTVGARFTKRFTEAGSLEFFVAAPFSVRGGRSASTEEAFVLTGDRLYNPAWGFQNGKVRNARVRREQLPIAQFAWRKPLTAATSLATTVGVEAGSRSYSGLNWYNARTPLPDNYRYLPSYTEDRATDEAWRNRDTRYTQIDWDRLFAANRMAGGQAVYTLEEQVERLCRIHAGVGFTTSVEERLRLRYGTVWQYRRARRFKRMRDLLGAEYVVDIDQYLVDDDTYGNLLQNNLRDPDRRIGEGDRFGYDYALCEHELEAFVQAEWHSDRFRIGATAGFGNAVRYRRGYYEKELFPAENSYGRSRRMNFTTWSLRAHAGWSFSANSYLEIAALAAAAAPDAEDLFYQPLYNNRTIDAPHAERHYAADLTWRLTGTNVRWQTAAFVAAVYDAGRTSRYYDDWAGVYSDMAVTGLGTCVMGVETALQLQLGRRWQLTAAGSAMHGIYLVNPTVTVLSDVDNSAVDAGSTSYMGDCHPGSVPRWTACAGAGYFGRKGWGFRLSAGYIGGRYVEPAPLRRTQRIARQAGTTPEAFAAFVTQERLQDAFTLDASLFKSFWLSEDARLTVALMARNLTDDDARYAGYESSRIRRRYAGDLTYWEPHATRYTTVYPRSFQLSVSCRF